MPPVGSPVRFTVRYNQRDANQPANFTYSNFGPKWTCDWISYITDNPSNATANARYYARGGGARTFTGANPTSQTFAFQQYDQTLLRRLGPASYEMTSPDGSKMVFGQPDGSFQISGAPTVTFDNVSLQLGELFKKTIGPVLNDIAKTLAPVQQVIDTLTAPIPVISDLVGHSASLVDLGHPVGLVDVDVALRQAFEDVFGASRAGLPETMA